MAGVKIKPNIAVVGTGYWGKNLVRNYYELESLKTVCDTNPDVLRSMQSKYPGIKITENYEQLLKDREIDGIVIALPAELHYSYTRDALEAGKHVYVEKPLALELSDAEKLISIAKSNKRVLMVGHLLQYHPVFQKLKEFVHNGTLGRIYYIYSNRLSLGKIRREENILWSFAPHDVSMILALCDEMPNKVYATGGYYVQQEIADVTVTHLTFPSGIESHIFVSWLHPFKEQKLIVVGEKKMAVFSDTEDWENKLLLYSHSITWENGVPVPKKADPERVPVEPKEPLTNESLHFLQCIRDGKQPITDGEEGLRVLRVLHDAQQHLESNG